MPEDILPPDKMQPLLQDVFIAEAKVQELRIPADSLKIEAQKFYLQICQSHGVSPDVFFRSLKFYSHRPLVLEKTITPLLDSLSAMEARNQ